MCPAIKDPGTTWMLGGLTKWATSVSRALSTRTLTKKFQIHTNSHVGHSRLAKSAEHNISKGPSEFIETATIVLTRINSKPALYQPQAPYRKARRPLFHTYFWDPER